MAIGKNIRDEVTLILPNDSAIRQNAEGVEAYDKYTEDGFNEAHLEPVMNGTKPTRFRLHRMSYETRKRSDELKDYPVERSDFILRASLKKIFGFELHHAGGRTTTLRQPDFETVEPWGQLVTKKWMDEADLPTDVINRLAGFARLLSEGAIPFEGSLSTPCTDSGSDESGRSEKSDPE